MLLDYGTTCFPPLGFSLEEGPRRFTGLHGAAFLGITQIFAAVLRMKEWDVNVRDSIKSVPFSDSMQDFLRQFDGLGRFGTVYGRTPLLWAAERGHEKVVKMLLAREDVDLGLASTGWTPLSLAAKYGHEGIVKMLLERENVDPNQADIRHGRTPLSCAAGRGHEGVVKMLLDWDNVDPDHADVYGRTPLSWAAECGHEGVVKMLLDRDNVNPDHVDTKYGRTPLSWAVLRGCEGVVRILSEAGRLAQERQVTGAKRRFSEAEMSAPTFQGPEAKLYHHGSPLESP